MKTELERLRAGAAWLREELRASINSAVFSGFEARVAAQRRIDDGLNAILHPAPEMETVEVKRSMCGNCERIHKTDQDAVNCCEETATCRAPIIHLIGTYTRPKEAMVERTWEMQGATFIADVDGAASWVRIGPYPDGAPFGKVGTLSFTWHEPKGE